MFKFGVYLFLIFVPLNLFPQSFTPNPDWRFENFNSQNHFISDEINALTMDKHGYIWVCSLGVQRFDGFKMVDFNSLSQEKGGLRDNYNDIIADNSGRVWVSSAGLCYYNDASGKFVYIPGDENHKITYVYSFLLKGNDLWFVCNFGLAKLDLRSLKISFTALSKVTDPLGTFMIDEHTLLVSSREKTYIYDIKTGSYTANTFIYDHALIKIFSVVPSNGIIYIGTNNGLFTLDNLKQITPVGKETNDAAIGDMKFLPQDKDERYLFLATEGEGLMVYNTVQKKIAFTYLHDDNNIYSLPNNIVSKLYIDKKGRCWLGSASGISMLDITSQQLKMRFLTKSGTEDLGLDKIARDKYDSTKVWMSSYNRGMVCVNWQTKNIEKIYSPDPQTKKIFDFVQLSENTWLLATAKKLIKWSPRSGILSQKKLPVPDSVSLFYNIRNLIMADEHTCFITTNKGLFKYDLQTDIISVASINNDPKHMDDPLKYILLSGFYDKGILWITSRDGLFSYNTATKATIVYSGKESKPAYYFFDIAKAPDDQIICASGTGIAVFDKQTKSFKQVNTIANIVNPPCAGVITINNTVWVASTTGILNYKLDTHKGARAEFETSARQISPSSSFTVIGNDIVFGFRNGYAYFTPGPITNILPSNPVIENVYVNNQLVSGRYPAENYKGSFVFSHTDNSINIAFTAFLYNDPVHINFRYQLKGADPKWQYTADQRSANYAQLEPGNYTFIVQSGNKNGVWNKHIASFGFTIEPPYWQTWWFRSIVTVTLALALYRLYRYRVENIVAIQQIREKIASDFHDEIGSALSSISIFSEVADKQLNEAAPPEKTREVIGHISFHSRAMLEAMDDIVWAVNPQNDHFNDLAVRMREFAIPLLEAKDIRFEIDIDESILNTRIKMDSRKNIFLIFKECINNLLKHSGCTAMKLSVSKKNNQMEFVITDNGCGFDMDTPSNRNGLKNMYHRAKEINGTIVLKTKRGGGTTTKLLVNII